MICLGVVREMSMSCVTCESDVLENECDTDDAPHIIRSVERWGAGVEYHFQEI